MSEYQYYEFRAIDRPLTDDQMGTLRDYSSRADITPTSFVNEYNWGNFKGDPCEWMEKYFDAFLYMTNWGVRWFMFRVPDGVLDPDSVPDCFSGEYFSCYEANGHHVLSFYVDDASSEWVEETGWLSSLIQLRSDVMNGDHRCLYLGWLRAVQMGEYDDDTREDLVPPGLKELTPSLEALAEFFDIDSDLITVAAEASPGGDSRGASTEDIGKWVAALSGAERDTLLTRLVAGDEPHLSAVLRRRAVSEVCGEADTSSGAGGGQGRRAADLVERAEAITLARKDRLARERAEEQVRREQASAEARRRYLASLVGREEDVWRDIEAHIATRQPRRYDEAVQLLKDLREVDGEGLLFSTRMRTLWDEHAKKTSLLKRFRQARLLS
ncbi:MAG: hypothetical protein GY851_01535 [bacterium]|nr:hypothetical protein [bacterium]